MCGINGFFSSSRPADIREQVVARMNDALRHRGPDSEGLISHNNVTLGHRRLSIIDLSPSCNQPFVSSDGRYLLVYNGELYNFRELKFELQRVVHGSQQTPYIFKTNSDTEVVIAAFARWGISCLDRFEGMYAFALYDKAEQKLWIARDRMGVKPVYFHQGKGLLLFSSEIRAILKSGLSAFKLNRERLAEYVMYQTVHAPATMVQGVEMLLPGHYMLVEGESLSITRYYDLNRQQGLPKAPRNYNENCEEIRRLLYRAVEKRLVSDVPFGAFLSGGIDSSAVVGIMSEVGTSAVRTFNVSFDESEFSESAYARLIANRFKTEHHEIRLRPDDFLQQLPDALSAMDHPSGDGTNTYVVSRATKNAGITMALSGIGSDELFAGYPVFKQMQEAGKKAWLNAVPQGVRGAVAFAYAKRNRTVAGEKMADLLREKRIDFVSAYSKSRNLFSRKFAAEIVKGDGTLAVRAIAAAGPALQGTDLSRTSLAEIRTYLQNVLLRDTDQMSMAVALEVREPFLDHHLVEYVLGVPDAQKFPTTPKKLLVDSLNGLLPAKIVNRPKQGFVLPWQKWIREELRTFCETHLRELDEREVLIKNAATTLWKKFLAGDALVPWSRVWHLVVLNDWIKKNGIET